MYETFLNVKPLFVKCTQMLRAYFYPPLPYIFALFYDAD